MLDREIAIYQRLIQQGAEVSFVTYGDHSDLDYAERLGEIKILCNVSSEPLEWYEENLLELHGNWLTSADVIKTNQTYGAQVALRVARELGVPLVARCGYLWSANATREYGKDSEQARMARCTEEEVFSAADAVVVTTSLMERDIASRIPGAAHKIEVIPNYVDTDLFRPMSVESTADSVLFVGRIAPEKNLDLLLEALASLPARLRIIGEGRLRPTLQNRFSYLMIASPGREPSPTGNSRDSSMKRRPLCSLRGTKGIPRPFWRLWPVKPRSSGAIPQAYGRSSPTERMACCAN